MKQHLSLAVLAVAAAFSSKAADADFRPEPVRPSPPPNLIRPTVWMGGGGNTAFARSDPAEVSRLLALMESDDETQRFPAAVLWLKETIGPFPHVLAMEKAVRSAPGDGIADAFLLYVQGILDWNELPEAVRRKLLHFVLREVVRSEDPPGRLFRNADGVLCRFVPDWKGSDARREAAALSLGDGVSGENGDCRVGVLQELDAMNPYQRIHRSLDSIGDDPLTSIPDAGRDSEAVRVAEAADYLSRFSFNDIHNAGESAEHFFRRKGIGPVEGFRVLATIIEETAEKPERALVREHAILALQCTDIPEAFDYAARLMETEKGFMATAAKSSATRLAEGNTNRLIRLQSLTDRLPPPGHEPPRYLNPNTQFTAPGFLYMEDP